MCIGLMIINDTLKSIVGCISITVVVFMIVPDIISKQDNLFFQCKYYGYRVLINNDVHVYLDV